jgi:hypothetical protein
MTNTSPKLSLPLRNRCSYFRQQCPVNVSTIKGLGAEDVVEEYHHISVSDIPILVACLTLVRSLLMIFMITS